MKISVCIATYRRPERLGALLDDLVKQSHRPEEVIMVDNDVAGSAFNVVQSRGERGAPYPMHYDIQAQRNISLTRNRSVEMAGSEWLAFIDDDERAPVNWLSELVQTIDRCRADGVLGPVVPIVPDDAPLWIRRGTFYNWARLQTGAVVPLNKLRFGNVLLRASLLKEQRLPFDPEYGLTGGEDGDLLARLVHQGAKILWCDEGCVYEPVERARLNFRWLLMRALRGGQDFARHRMAGRYERVTPYGHVRFFLRALLQSMIAAIVAIIVLPAGSHRAAYWLLKASANIGKMSIFLGWHYREYGGKVP